MASSQGSLAIDRHLPQSLLAPQQTAGAQHRLNLVFGKQTRHATVVLADDGFFTRQHGADI